MVDYVSEMTVKKLCKYSGYGLVGQQVKIVLFLFPLMQVYTMVVAYIIVVAVYWRPESRRMLSRLAIPVWVSVVLHVASAAGLLRVPLLIALVAMMVVGFLAEINQASQQEGAGE